MRNSATIYPRIALSRGQSALGLVAVYKALGGGWQGAGIGDPCYDPQPFAPPDLEIPLDVEP